MTRKDKKELKKAGYTVDKLKLENFTLNKEMSLSTFIYNFLAKYNRRHSTLYINDDLQTECKKHRSLGDIFMICNYYYPKCTLHEVFECLKKRTDIVGHICPTIDRRVYEVIEIFPTWSLYQTEKEDEFRKTLENTKSIYVKK